MKKAELKPEILPYSIYHPISIYLFPYPPSISYAISSPSICF